MIELQTYALSSSGRMTELHPNNYSAQWYRREDVDRELAKLRDGCEELKTALRNLCKELEERTYPDYGDRKASYVSGNVCTGKTFNAAKALSEKE